MVAAWCPAVRPPRPASSRATSSLAVNGKSVEDNRDLTRRVAMLAGRFDRDLHRLARRAAEERQGHDRHAPGRRAGGIERRPARRSAGAEATGEAMGLGLAAVTPEVRRAYNIDDNVSRRGHHQGRSQQRRRRQGHPARRRGRVRSAIRPCIRRKTCRPAWPKAKARDARACSCSSQVRVVSGLSL